MLTLFFVAFIAATMWPMASEAYVVYLVSAASEQYITIWVVASAGNALGSIAMFELARWSAPWFESKLTNVQEKHPNVLVKVRRYGTPSLFFAWLPIVGDALPLMAGALNFSRSKAYAWLIIGKAARYAIVIVGVISVF
ncbi:hypothetical protein QWZ13_13845 [Reinekea marina]|uniref:YqaA family protein n=1 Tax=Reinekea marina TaxID=1310421 RepID=A0ABV7WU82_9GAMM|nr:VTT domain-containing protein [Reinekea marina]MBU2862443.1 hypothetical protein [Reinekea forsetii]MDN3649998.1 hypothetical protein [Reinekea marina]